MADKQSKTLCTQQFTDHTSRLPSEWEMIPLYWYSYFKKTHKKKKRRRKKRI